VLQRRRILFLARNVLISKAGPETTERSVTIPICGKLLFLLPPLSNR
jgi:hypothetical protein